MISTAQALSNAVGGDPPIAAGTSIGSLWVSADEGDDNAENNRAEILVNLLPSKNVPPRIEILSPKADAVITRSAKKLTKITFTIKAFDLDGTIEKVNVNTQQFGISVEYPENRIVIEGKSYSIKDVEDNKVAFQKYFGGEAKKIGKDTYSFTLENPRYGFNNVFVEAVDTGKRVGGSSITFTVKGDNSIEFTKPLKDSVVKPNTNVIIESITKLNDETAAKLELIGQALCCEPPPVMKQVARIGNIYTHQYLLKNVTKGHYYLQVFMTEDSGAFIYSEGLQFKVTEKPRVKITSITNGQVFKEGDEIPIEIEAVDPDGEVKDVTVRVDGKYERHFSWRAAGHNKRGYIYALKKGVHTIHAKVTDDMDVEAESEPITIIIK